jgi:beta-lactamase regulating signal transducer with metallopeptidase domain
MVTLLWWLASNALVVAILMPVVWLVCKLLRSRPAVGHLLWFLLFVKLITPPVLNWPWPVEDVLARVMDPRAGQAEDLSQGPLVVPAEVPRDRAAAEIIDAETSVSALTISAPIAREVVQPVYALPAQSYLVENVAVFGWTIGALLLLVFTIRGVLRQRRIVRNSSPAPAHLLAEVDRVARYLGLQPPKAAVSVQISTPVLCCLGRPRLLWPASISEPETVAHCEGIVAHELAHLARRDHYFLYAELVVAVCCWWNPLMWIIRRRLRETRELACDAVALSVVQQPRCDYARRLLALSVSRSDSLVVAPAFGAGILSRRFLKRRLTMVFDERVDGRVSLAGVALAAVLIAVGLPGLTFADPQTEPAGGSASSSSAEATQSLESSATAGSEDLPGEARSRFGRSLRLSRVVKSDEISHDKSAEIKLGSSGIIRISKNEQGDLVVTVEQNEAGESARSIAPGESARRIEVRDADPRSGGASADFGPRRRISGGGSASSFGGTVRRNVVRESGGSDSRPDIDRQLLQSDVELANVGLLEKRAELEIARNDKVDAGLLKLAELAVRRAEIELARAKLKLQGSGSATSRERVISRPGGSLEPATSRP